HWYRVPHFFEFSGRCRTDSLRRRVGTDEFRKAPLNRGIALAQGVVFGVRYGRCVLLVVTFVVRRDFSREPLQLGLRLRFGEVSHWSLCGGFGRFFYSG